MFYLQDRQRSELENERESILHKHTLEKEDMQNRYDKLKEEMEDQISVLTRDRDNSLLMAENDRQQVRYHWTIFSLAVLLRKHQSIVLGLWSSVVVIVQ